MARKKASRSKFEQRVWDNCKENNIEVEYEPFAIAYLEPEKKRKYTPDWLITSSGIFVETKGFLSHVDRYKHILIKEQHPEFDIRLLFMYDNKLTKTSKTRYTDWCEKNGFICAVGDKIPKEWL